MQQVQSARYRRVPRAIQLEGGRKASGQHHALLISCLNSHRLVNRDAWVGTPAPIQEQECHSQTPTYCAHCTLFHVPFYRSRAVPLREVTVPHEAQARDGPIGEPRFPHSPRGTRVRPEEHDPQGAQPLSSRAALLATIKDWLRRNNRPRATERPRWRGSRPDPSILLRAQAVSTSRRATGANPSSPAPTGRPPLGGERASRKGRRDTIHRRAAAGCPQHATPRRNSEGPGIVGDFPNDSGPFYLRAMQDSNLRPLAPEANALSS